MYNVYLSNAAIIVLYYISSHKVMTCTTYIYLSQSALYQSCNIVYLVIIVIYIYPLCSCTTFCDHRVVYSVWQLCKISFGNHELHFSWKSCNISCIYFSHYILTWSCNIFCGIHILQFLFLSYTLYPEVSS